MSLPNYTRLQQRSQNEPAIIGCQLPLVEAGQLTIEHQPCTAARLGALLADAGVLTGWLMYTDQVVLKEDQPGTALTLTDVLEAELCTPDLSVHIRHRHGEEYSVTWYRSGPADSDTRQVFRCRDWLLRPGIADEQRLATYAHWWQVTEEGRWEPLAQVFQGLKSKADTREV